MIPLIDLKPNNKQIAAIKKSVSRVIDANSFILGKELELFEKKFAKMLSADYAIGVGSGTDAIRLALRALGIGNGDKVLTVSMTSPFTVIPIIEEGAIPVFCDVDEKSWTMDVEDCLRKIDNRVKAIIPVHIYGNPAKMTSIVKIAKKYKLKIIEDACQAHGAQINNRYVGNFGDAAAFSFYPTKNLGAMGDAGIVVTNNKKVANLVRLLRHGGQTKRFWHVYQGTNSRLDEIQAAILSTKIKWLNRNNGERAKLVKKYKKAFFDLPIIFQEAHEDSKSVNHLCVIRTKNRNDLHNFLLKKKILTDVYYPYPVHKQPAFSKFFKDSLPVTERLSQELLAIPLYPEMKSTEQEIVIAAMRDYYLK